MTIINSRAGQTADVSADADEERRDEGPSVTYRGRFSEEGRSLTGFQEESKLPRFTLCDRARDVPNVLPAALLANRRRDNYQLEGVNGLAGREKRGPADDSREMYRTSISYFRGKKNFQLPRGGNGVLTSFFLFSANTSFIITLTPWYRRVPPIYRRHR